MANDKKKNNKKTKNVKNKNGNKLKIIIPIVIVLVIVVIVLAISLSGKKTIECTKSTNEDGVQTNTVITIKMKNEKIDNIKVNRTLKVDTNDDEINYISALKDSLNEAYENIGVKHKVTQNDDGLMINLTYEDEKEYILDNIFVNLEENGLSVNVISEDGEGIYATVDLSKDYSDENVINILEKADYSCEN